MDAGGRLAGTWRDGTYRGGAGGGQEKRVAEYVAWLEAAGRGVAKDSGWGCREGAKRTLTVFRFG